MDESIKVITNGCSELKELYVYSKDLMDEAINEVSAGCPRLEKLNVPAIHNLTVDMIVAITTGCPKLKARNGSVKALPMSPL